MLDVVPVAWHDEPDVAPECVGRREQRAIDSSDAARRGVVGVGQVERFEGPFVGHGHLSDHATLASWRIASFTASERLYPGGLTEV
ncbi:MAG: hypothetical protein QM736_12250 [Vicinamibacterales bacterium]